MRSYEQLRCPGRLPDVTKEKLMRIPARDIGSMRLLALLLFALHATCSTAQTLAFTFDDGIDPRVTTNASALNDQILDALRRSQVRAALLPVAGRVNTPEGLALVRQWGEQGHLIGNHSYSHKSLAATSSTDFTADIDRAHEILKSMPGFRAWFRFPYLKEGDTVDKRDAVRLWLQQHDYRTLPVSVDASDWYYNTRMLDWQAVDPTRTVSGYRTAYLDHLWDRASYYDSLARKLLGRSPAHIILLHTNAINATFLADAIQMFRSRGWVIVSPQQAVNDPLYAMQPTRLPAGESIVWALAKQSGEKGLRYPGESDVYEKNSIDRMEKNSR
jgi:peptidoglycan/xylan/chitin deacetylase (PgdA/CDA1 family)